MKKNQAALLRWLRIGFWVTAILLGSLHAYVAATNYSMNADGISYLDIGDAYFQGDWATAINPVWSPVYSWLLGLSMLVFKPSMQWEFALVHVVNLVIFIFSMGCFEFFWRQLWQDHLNAIDQEGNDHRFVAYPAWAWWALGYALFIWTSLGLIELWAVTPDMFMAALVYLAAAMVVRIRRGSIGWYTYGALGFILGIGYLTKAIMLPLGFAILLAAWIAARDRRETLPKTGLALMIFLVICGIYIAIISSTSGRLTYSDAGTITYARYVNRVPYPHWQGIPPGNGAPTHPTRLIYQTPPIYEFASPIGGTYPVSLNPYYWYEGLSINFDLGNQLRAMLANGLFYFELFIHQLGILFGCILILLMFSFSTMHKRGLELRSWALLLPTLGAFGLYSLVYVEGRYIAVFVLLLFGELLRNIKIPTTDLHVRFSKILSSMMVAILILNILAFNLAGVSKLASPSRSYQTNPSPSWPGEVAVELWELGIQPGDQVGVIGYGFESFWARLARVKIVAEMFEWQASPFYLGGPEAQQEILLAFGSTGAKAIVAEHVPAYAQLDDWYQVGDTNFFIYHFENSGGGND